MSLRRTLPFVCCLLVLLSGCVVFPTESEPPTVSVTVVNVTEETQNGETKFSGELVALDHYSGRFNIEDIHIVFVNGGGEPLRKLKIGTTRTTSFRKNISTTLPEPSREVLIKTGKTRSGANIDLFFLRRNASGGLEYYLAEDTQK